MSVFAEARFPTTTGERRSPTPSRVQIVQKLFHHDVVVVETMEQLATSERNSTGTPITVTWGRAPNGLVTVHGYINHFEPAVGLDEQRTPNRMVVVGPTWMLKGRGQRVWRNVRSDRVARDLCREIRLACRSDLGPRIRDVFQDGKSSWRLMSDLALEDGLVLFSRDSQVHLRDPDKLMQIPESAAPHFTAAAGASVGHRVLEFRPLIGELTPEGGENAEWHAYATVAGSPVRVWKGATSDVRLDGHPAPQQRGYLDEVYASISQARAAIDASARRNRRTYRAEAVVDGRASVQPGSVISLDEVGRRSDGLWLVEEAEHTLTQGDYRLRLTLGRGSAIDTRRHAHTGKATIPVLPAQAVTPRAPTVLLAGRWGAMWGGSR